VLNFAYVSRGKLLRSIVKIAPKTRISSLAVGSEIAASAAAQIACLRGGLTSDATSRCDLRRARFLRSIRGRGDDIPPPFGFRWNDPSAKVEQVLVAAKAKIVSREPKEKREVWTVEGLVQPGLKRTLFEFKEGFLSRSSSSTSTTSGQSKTTTIGWAKSAATSTESSARGSSSPAPATPIQT
jgi:hypothetical protein